MKIPKKQMQKWINALRSEKYKQSRGALQNGRGFCCLGVACDLFIDDNSKRLNDNGYLYGSMPYAQPYAPEWLKKIDAMFCFKTGACLTALNDTDRFTFDEIADCLQAVYIEGALNK